MSISVFANEASVDILSPIPPAPISDIQTRGSNPPKKNADVHDISKIKYNYQVDDVGYRVYTSKWLTGKDTYKISVENWEILKSSIGATNNKLTIRVYNKNKKEVNHKTITISDDCGSAKIKGLSSTDKYYICFEVPSNCNKYSFNGSIS